MTRKDYRIIAECIYNAVPDSPRATAFERGQFDACDQIAIMLADALASYNPRFDRAKFLAACGLSDN